MADVDGRSPGQRLGGALRALQQRSGRTLRSLESEVMISDSSLSRYLRGSTVPPWNTVRDLCRALGADPAEYRALWEAADRSQPAAPPAPPPPPAPPWWRARWRWPAVAGLAGLLAGAALAWFVPLPGREPRSGPQAAEAAAAPPRHDTVRNFVNRSTGNCLDHSLDQGLRSFPPNGMSYQRWTLHPLQDGSGTGTLRNHASGACLAGDATGLSGRSCGNTASQKWTVTTWPDASVEVKSNTTGQCLDDGPTGLRLRPCDRSDHQKWG
ncbi:helix-turn-helix domain-containing protein [Streptomyces sp. NPDC090077]|uniref:helix-turn-helix domain-containing protein n=1 Tax=Streptomyces sp. NPDC090077 TaxID=3365938 RepID=UPI0037FBD674